LYWKETADGICLAFKLYVVILHKHSFFAINFSP